MTVLHPDWRAVGTFDPASERGPESFAPPDRRAPKKPGDADHIASLRRQHAEAHPEEALRALIQRVAGASMDEIDRVVGELEGVRDMLRNEGDRVSREIAGYASLSHASMTAMKVFADSIKQFKDEAGRSHGPSR